MLLLYLISILSFVVQGVFLTLSIEVSVQSPSPKQRSALKSALLKQEFHQGSMLGPTLYLIYTSDLPTSESEVAAGLFYIAELIEEYTVMAKNVISWIVVITSGIYVGFILFEDFPLYLNLIGLFQQILYGLILKKFPVVRLHSFTFILALVTLVAHHYFSFSYFGSNRYAFSEMLGYYTVCMWLVPFALFVSLTANDCVLPTVGERQRSPDDDNVVTDYLSRKAKRYSLLSFFSIAKESILPQRVKKF